MIVPALRRAAGILSLRLNAERQTLAPVALAFGMDGINYGFGFFVGSTERNPTVAKSRDTIDQRWR